MYFFKQIRNVLCHFVYKCFTNILPKARLSKNFEYFPMGLKIEKIYHMGDATCIDFE